MSTFSQNNVQYLAVGGTANKTAAGSSLTAANAGEICILSENGKILSEANAATEQKFKVGLRRGAHIDFVSDIIDKSKISFIGRKTYAAAVQQVSYVGYNGTSGSIDANDNELYYLRIYLEDLFARGSGDGKSVKHGVYKSGTSATQKQIAEGVVESLINNFSRETEQQVRFELVNDEAGTAFTGTAANLTVTKGSKVVAIDGTLVEAAAGAVIRLGGAGTSNAVYEIASYTASSDVTLKTPYQGDDATIAVADTMVIAGVAAAAAEYGIKMTGVPADFDLGKIKYKIVRFEPQVDTTEGFGPDTLITNATAASSGTGTIPIVKEMEWFMQGHEGEFFRKGGPLIFDRKTDASSAVAGGGYSLIDIMFVDDSVVGFQPNVSKKHLTLAIPATTPAYALTGNADDITDVLEVLKWGATNGNLALT